MRKIAKQLSVSTSTVSKILQIGQNTPQCVNLDTNVQLVVPKALKVVENAIDAGNSLIAMRFLERTALAEDRGDKYTIAGDVSVQQHLTLLPGTTITPSTTSPAESTVSTGTEAAAKPPQSDMSLSSQTNFSPDHANFSQFSDEQLEQELARRRSARAIDAEIIR